MEKLSNTSSPLAYSNVIGVTLIITSGDNLPCPLTFFKAASPVVNIGRTPSSKASQTDDDTAWFRCAVVSRKHAKIVFSNSGQVYLVDLCSRHGTYVFRSGDKLCKKLEPESPTPLNDGDVITFGKIVGRDIGIVRPVTARIKFISRSSPPPTSDRADESNEFPFTPSPNKSSGRFGVAYTSSSSSSSDIEELGGPESTSSSHIYFEDHVEQHLRKHILPPLDFSMTRSISRSRSAENLNLEDGKHDAFVMLGDAMSIIGEETEHHFSHHADMSLPPSPTATGPVYMQVNRYNSVFDTDPNVIGAWPGSPVSPISQPGSSRFAWDPIVTEEPAEDDGTDSNGSFQNQERSKASPAASEEEIKRSQSPSFCGAEDLPPVAETKLDTVVKDDKMIVDHASELKEEVSRIRDTVEQVFTDVQLLRYSKRKAASHIHKAEKRLETVDKRLAHVDALCSSHSDTISKIIDAEILRIAEREEEVQMKDSALNALIEELRAFREETTKKITTEVEALKAAREEALATISTFTAQMAEIKNMPSSSPCLKRKRSEDEDVLPDIEVPRCVNKRIRNRLVSKILQTAGVFTVGAVATWSALAFS